jgi:hypothetical protein
VADVLYEMGVWLYKLLMTAIIAAVCILLVSSAVKTELNTRELQGDLLLNRILYSPDSVWYTEGGAVRPGVIDLQKFTQEQMNNNFIYRDGYGGANITLSYGNEKKSIFIEKNTFDLYKKQYNEGWKNGGVLDTRTYPVVVRTASGEVNGMLVIEIAMPEKA